MTRPEPSPERLLAIYLRYHAAASHGGLDLFRRAARTQSDQPVRDELSRLAAEVAQDQRALLGILRALGIPRNRLAERAVSWTETIGRLKPNGTWVRRSRLSDVMELEALGVGVQAKKLGWQSLRQLCGSEDRLDEQRLDDLVRRATDQQDRIEELRLYAVRRTFVDTGAESAGRQT